MDSLILTKIKNIKLFLILFAFFSSSGLSFSSDIFSTCGGDFQNFLDQAKIHAQKKGISEKAISEALKFTKFNKKIIDENFILSSKDFKNNKAKISFGNKKHAMIVLN